MARSSQPNEFGRIRINRARCVHWRLVSSTPAGLAPGQPFVRDFATHVGRRIPVALQHDLSGHPAFTLDALADLATHLGSASVSVDTAVKPLVGTAVPTHALGAATIADRIRGLGTGDSWFTLLNIEQQPAYATLVDAVLDGIADGGGTDRSALRRRMGFVFASSPGSVTPAHIDIEHSLLLQLSGHRRIALGTFESAEAREREVRRYWGGSFGRLASMPVPGAEFDLEPGTGVYIPPYRPHWIRNGPETSVSLTVTFFERSNEDESIVQALNERLRRLGIEPRPYGTSPARDRLKVAVVRAARALRSDSEHSRSGSR
jgi:hypothetical protein